MTRFIGQILAVVSAAVCVALVAGWTASPWRSGVVAFFAHGGAAQLAVVHRHSLVVGFSNVAVDGRAWTVDGAVVAAENGAEVVDRLAKPVSFERGWMGVRVMRGPADAFGMKGKWYTLVFVPLWMGVAGSVILPALVGRRWWIVRGRRRRGACLHCGYDLRESPGRCPECGAGRGARAAGGEGVVGKEVGGNSAGKEGSDA